MEEFAQIVEGLPMSAFSVHIISPADEGEFCRMLDVKVAQLWALHNSVQAWRVYHEPKRGKMWREAQSSQRLWQGLEE